MFRSRRRRWVTSAAPPMLWLAAGLVAFGSSGWAADAVKVGFFVTYLPSEIEANILVAIATRHSELGVSAVKLVGTDVAVSWVGLQRGDLDVLLEVDLPNQQPLLDKAKGDVELLSQIYADAEEGFFVPRYAVTGANAPAAGLQSVADLPKYKEVFAGKLYDEAPGWKSTRFNDMRVKAYAPGFEHVALSDAALVAQIARAIDRKQPIVFFFSHPHWLFKTCDLVKLAEPDPFHPGCFEGELGRCAVPSFSAWLGARKDLAARVPRFQTMLRSFRIPIEDLEQMMFDVTQAKRPVSAVASGWVDAHRRDVDRWAQAIGPSK